MKIGVLKYPGGHGERELIHVMEHHFNMDVREVWYREEAFPDINILFIGGGFPCSRGIPDRRCLDEFPVLRWMPAFSESGGIIVGLGNGFHLLCEAGLLPGELLMNHSEKFICRQVYIKPENHTSAITAGLEPDGVFRIPIATEYGKYAAPEDVLVKMRQEGQILFRFCNYEGRITESVNCTGSTDNIAAVCNSQKNIFGLIPQPERAVSEFRDEADGKMILSSFLEQLK